MDVIASRQPWMRLAVWLTMATFIIGTSSHRHAQCVRSQDHGPPLPTSAGARCHGCSWRSLWSCRRCLAGTP